MRARTVCALAVPLVLTALPLAWSPSRGVETAAAACDDGTCCPQEGSDCIINGILTHDAYAKLGGGSCEVKPHPGT